MDHQSSSSKNHHWLNNTDEPGVLFCSTGGCKKFTSSYDGMDYVLIQTGDGSLRWIVQPETTSRQNTRAAENNLAVGSGKLNEGEFQPEMEALPG